MMSKYPRLKMISNGWQGWPAKAELRELLAEREEAIEMLKESLLYIPNIGTNTRGVRCAPALRSLGGRIMAFLDTAYGVRR